MGSLTSRPKMQSSPQVVYMPRPNPDYATLEECYDQLKELAGRGTLELKKINGQFRMAFYPRKGVKASFVVGAEICELLNKLAAPQEDGNGV